MLTQYVTLNRIIYLQYDVIINDVALLIPT